jgi:hypothetical protein
MELVAFKIIAGTYWTVQMLYQLIDRNGKFIVLASITIRIMVCKGMQGI